MNKLIAAIISVLPAAAYAYGEVPGGSLGPAIPGAPMGPGPLVGYGAFAGPGGPMGPACGAFAPILICGVLAALGYWVLQHAAKETGSLVKRTGIAVGMTLVVIGLLGLLCGVGAHARKSMPNSCAGQQTIMNDGQRMMMRGEGKMGMNEMQEPAKTSGAEKKTR